MRNFFITISASSISLWGEVESTIDFNDHVQPILSEYCYHCHGPDGSTRYPKADKGGQPLRLDREDDAFEIREDTGEPVIIKGNPDASRLIQTIVDKEMPPKKAHKIVGDEELEILKQWIREGAPYEEHWSFLPPQRPELPELSSASHSWVGNEVDHFVAARHKKEGVTPNPPEESHRLLRRLTLDLTGLPPTPEQLESWEGDVAKATEELLGSREYAEHFARHWLDAARYGDTHGIHIDNYRAIWPYRDWVLEAIHQNMPFDRFTREQIAGDMMPDASLEQKVASGFNRCLATTGEGGAIAEEWDAIYAQERVDTLSAVWLGLSTGCAACHDHKFDPITQKDNFALTAFFRNTTMSALDRNQADHPPSIFVPALGDREAWVEVEERLLAQQKKLDERNKAAQSDFEAWAEELHQAGPEGLQPKTSDSIDQGLVLSLALNQDKGEIEGAYHGEAMTWSQRDGEFIDGPLGPATIVNGSKVDLGNIGNLDAKGKFSYGMLFYYEGKPNGPIISKMDSPPSYRGWDFWMEKDKLVTHLIDSWTGKAHKFTASEPLQPKTWHHVMVTYDGTKREQARLVMHLNGEKLRGSFNYNSGGEVFENSKPLRLGARADGLKLYGGKAAIQDFRIYDRVLRYEELKELADLVNLVPLGVAATIPLSEMSETQQKTLRRSYLNQHDEIYRALKLELHQLEEEQDELRGRGSMSLVMDDRKDREPYAHILTRGDYRLKAEKVLPAVPKVLPQLPPDVKADRLALADWLVRSDNPLPARVTVNRFWYYFFGTGIVETTEDFGIMGARPTHPQLLDWLAVEFVESGWDVQHLIRLIVSSKTYQQSGRLTPESKERDPNNELLARGPRYRLDAEQIRDLALSASGLLVEKWGGPSVKPYQPQGVWEAVAMNESNTRFYKQDSGDDLFRRSLYTFWKRTAPPASLDLFDAPSRETFCVRRSRTNTPLQAFVLMNDPQFVEASRHLAENALQGEASFEGRVRHLYLTLLGREPRESERAIIEESLALIHEDFKSEPERAAQLLQVGATNYDQSLDKVEFASWTVLASKILNLDETITK